MERSLLDVSLLSTLTFLAFMVFEFLRVKLHHSRTPFLANFLSYKTSFNTRKFYKKYNMTHEESNERTKRKVKIHKTLGVISIYLASLPNRPF